jgi:hypothetical protein
VLSRVAAIEFFGRVPLPQRPPLLFKSLLVGARWATNVWLLHAVCCTCSLPKRETRWRMSADTGQTFWGTEKGEVTESASSQAGGGAFALRPNFGSLFSGAMDWFSEAQSRPNEKVTGTVVMDNIDKQFRPPRWMEDKDIDILGRVIDKAKTDHGADGSTWWKKKYERELAIGEMRYNQKREDDVMEMHDMIGTYRSVMRSLGRWDGDRTRAEQHEQVTQQYEARRAAAHEEDEQRRMDWETFVAALESDKPLLSVAQQYRNVYDCFGIDDFLDNAPSVLWLAFKIGTFVGIAHGGGRAMKALHIDAHFMKASGIGVMTFTNVSIIAGLVKWAGNTTMCAAMFIAGDRAVRQLKRLTMPSGVEPHRTPANYAAGLSLSFGVVGILPWWLLNDSVMGLRLAASGMVLGSGIGYAAGMGLQHLIALNLNRLDYTPSQFRSYQALMKRESKRVDAEVVRLKKQQRDNAVAGLGV